jgi:hypothetical protein
MKLRIRLATAVAAFGLALAGFFAASAPAVDAATYLGGVSVAGACSNQLWIAPSAVRTEIIAWNVTGWRCGYLTSMGWVWWWTGYNINLNQQCAYQYGPGAYAAYTNYYNPYSWGCYR